MNSDIDSDAFLLTRPFGDDSQRLMVEWFDAARLFLFRESFFSDPEDFRAQVNGVFQSVVSHFSRSDRHIFRSRPGLYESLRSNRRVNPNPNSSVTRAFLLMQGDFDRLGSTDRDLLSGQQDDQKKLRLFSPLFFLRRILTSDDYLASGAYAHAIIRAEIFAATLRSFSPGSGHSLVDPYEFISNAITFKNISQSLETIQSYVAKRDLTYMSSPSDFIVGNLLASYGYATLSFAGRGHTAAKARRSEKDLMSIDYFLDSRSLDSAEDQAYEIRIVPDIELPTAAQILSELDGIPLAVPGARTIFSGGIRGTENSGAVVRITGQSGTGKTTLALSLCVALAPLGTRTFYLSCEEEEADLLDRLNSVTPQFIANTRTFVAPEAGAIDSWFNAFHLSADDATGNFLGAMSFVDSILAAFEAQGMHPTASRPPGLTPFVVVLDGVHELIRRDAGAEDDQVKNFHALVDKLRHLNALVVLLSADIESPAFRALDYLVDVVVSLDGDAEQRRLIDNLRTLRLQKTRRQFSYAGTHRYHISRSGGARIFPSLPAILDQFKRQRWQEPDRATVFDFLLAGDEYSSRPYLRIYRNSHVLITGRGSSGKASFALRLLTAPFEADEDGPLRSIFYKAEREVQRERRRVLIISFLYPDTYYDALVRGLHRAKFSDRRYMQTGPSIVHTVLSFYPGGMPSEVLLTKVTEELRRGYVQGVPYDAVLIDGLHNVFLQFPSLEDDTLIWPMMSEIFRRSGLTVAITHAHFDVIGMNDDHHLAMDVRSMSNRSTPLLQSLVNSADYYIDVSPLHEDMLAGLEEDNPELGECALIKVGTALGQPIPRRPRLWNRTTMSVRNLEDLGLTYGDLIQG